MGQHKLNKPTQVSAHRVEFEQTAPLFEQANTLYALDIATNLMGGLLL
jgi:hypothetical protein